MAVETQRQGEGWLIFAGVMLFIGGFGRIIDAIWAWRYDDEYPAFQAVVFDGNLAAYGWVWFILGVVLIVAAFGVLARQQWARWFGIVVAAVAAFAALSWIYFQPLWSVIAVILNVLVVYALATYGAREGANP